MIGFLLLAACGDGGDSAGATSGESSTAGSQGATTGSGGGSSASSGAGGSGTGGGGTGAAMSFEKDIWPILTMPRDPPFSGANDSCAGANGCHLGGAGGLTLPDAKGGYANLLNAPSTSALCAGKLRVVPNQPDDSCFVVFYEQRLRDSLGWVDAAETDLIRKWVTEGAAP